MKIAWAEEYCHALPAGHRFPMEKYELIPEQLLYEGSITAENLFRPERISKEDALLTHDQRYWQKLMDLDLSRKEERRTGFPLSEALVIRELLITQGTVDCARYALEYGAAMNVAGGTHHAFVDYGEGFCLLNDFACAANVLLRDGDVGEILILDLDVHQGNGTAAIFAEEDRVYTFSMHGAKNFPMEKPCSDWDIGLADGTSDEQYLRELESALAVLSERRNPDIVFYLSGVDVLETDKLGRLALSIEGCRQRDEMVIQLYSGLGVPMAVSMGGGYSAQISRIVEAHSNTFRLVKKYYF